MPRSSARLASATVVLRRRLRRLALVLVAGPGSAASAQVAAAEPEPILNPVVVTGSRVEAESFDLPFSVDVIEVDRMRDANAAVNASEVLAGVPGLVVQNRQNYAQDLQISIRGFGARSAFGVRGVKLIADGIPASNPDGQGQAATFNLDTAARIEVLRGPFSTIYGNHAGGVIQVFSRDPQGAPSLRASALAGAWGTSKFGVGAEGEKNGVGYLLDASRFDTEGYRNHSAATREQAFAKLNFAPDADSTLTLTASGLRQPDTDDPLGLTWGTYRRDPRAAEPVAELFDTRKRIDHVQGGATYERRFGDDRLQLVAYAGQRAVTQYQSIPAAAQGNSRHSGGVIDFDRDFHGVGARWTGRRAIGAGKLTFTAGIDLDRSEDDRQGFENFSGTALGVKGRLRRDETDTVTSVDPYLQASWEQGAWQWSAGVRHSRVEFDIDDDYRANGDDSGGLMFRKTTPALGVVYKLSPAVNFYASAARGFETPTLTELAYSGAGGAAGFNFNLKPATSEQLEIGAKAFVGDNTRVNFALFHVRTDNELVVESSSGGRTVFKNAGTTRREGIEFAVDTTFSPDWRGRFSLTGLRAVYDEAFVTGSGAAAKTILDGRRLPGIPALSAYAELEWIPVGGMAAALEGSYRSKVYVEDTNTERAAPAHALLNLRVTAEQKSGAWTFNEMLRLDNLFDREHLASVIVGDRNGRFYEPGPERSWYAGVRAAYRF